MDVIWWFVIGVAAGIGLGLVVSAILGRRMWRNARRMTARAKGHEHLVEVGQLVGGLAHEIKNPLSTIHLNLKLLAEDLQQPHHQDEEHRRWLRRLRNVQGEADRLKAILDDFLRFAGKFELAPAKLDIRRLVEELVDFFAPQAQVAGVVMRTAMPDQPVICPLDANLIKQAMLNLMINATQAMPDGGEMLLKLATSRGRAILEVIDTGTGIPLEDVQKIFNVYFSTKPGGTGLGLPTTRRIIREHGGTIRVQSEPGKGTRFIISLPLTQG